MEQDFGEILLHLARIADSLERMANQANGYSKQLAGSGGASKETVKVSDEKACGPKDLYEPIRKILLARMREYQKNTAAGSSGRLGMGEWQMKVGVLTQLVNEDLGLASNLVKAQHVGHVLRTMKHVTMSARMRDGFYACWNAGDLEED